VHSKSTSLCARPYVCTCTHARLERQWMLLRGMLLAMLYLCFYIYLFVRFIPVLHVPPPRARTCSCMVVWAVVFCCILERRTVGRSNGMISLLEEVERLKVPAVCPSVTASVSVSVSVSLLLSADYQSLLRCATRPRLGVSSRRMHTRAHAHTRTCANTRTNTRLHSHTPKSHT